MKKDKDVLLEVVTNSGLDKTKSNTLLENFTDYYKIASEWELKSKKIIVNDVTQVEEMKLAREGRLFLKEKRVLIEKTRKTLKESSLREGQAIDSIAKLLTNLIVPIENDLELKEKFKELKEKEEKDKLREERSLLVADYMEFIPINVDLADFTDIAFNTVLTGAKAQHEAKLQEQKKIEEEKKEAFRISSLDTARRNELRDLELWSFLDSDIKNMNFGIMTDKYYQGLISDMTNRKVKKDEELQKIKEENELLKLELQKKSEITSPPTPIKTKKVKNPLKAWVESFQIPQCPVEDSRVTDIVEKFELFKKWSLAQIEK
jgi:hypothetical protein